MPQVDSTNNYVANLLDKMSAEKLCNTVFQADFQSAGKGAYKNSWESNNSQNLLFSIIICPQISVENQFIISKTISLSLIDYLKSKNIKSVIKWPNDILIDNKKIAGILIENSIIGKKIKNSIIGIGLNVNQLSFSGKFNATSLSLLTKNTKYELTQELNLFLSFFEKWSNICRTNNIKQINSEYFENLLGTNEFLMYKTKKEQFLAKIYNIDGFGRLILKLKNNEYKTFAFKEVELIL